MAGESSVTSFPGLGNDSSAALGNLWTNHRGLIFTGEWTPRMFVRCANFERLSQTSSVATPRGLGRKKLDKRKRDGPSDLRCLSFLRPSFGAFVFDRGYAALGPLRFHSDSFDFLEAHTVASTRH